MKIIFNDSMLELSQPIFLNDFIINQLGHANGIALAINQKIVPNYKWEKYKLQDGDDIIVFQAIAGG
ncbi:thiamine biosynthesis protein ThiS (plasmid) [Candidatus Pantoea edessiphila]|uniref:Thiamine biosynthesis protein ThiS n=1 Tax=Candidatus Pantoea edessiphila TaxID=2044610 RepID=A0A2P5T167_9GAMM|nr:sulfur carrier protein ThiS [Candidatus Pantoea edessiphila]PPI88327.1 thiamine biosynthesis protein ThiS [Candidatus Pantoea edessiphila]